MSKSTAKKRKIETEEDLSDLSSGECEVDLHEKPANKYSKWRTTIRNASSFSDCVRISQQTCKTANNKKVLLAWKKSSGDVLQSRIDGLLAVLETLQLPSTHRLQTDIQETEEGFPNIKHGGLLGFQEGFELYIDHTNVGKSSSVTSRDDTLKSLFLLDLLNDKYGIRCVIILIRGKRFIVLDNDDINIPSVLSQLIVEFEEAKEREQKLPDFKFIRDSLATIDTEYDRNIFHSVLSTLLSRDDLNTCGINPTRAKAKELRMREVLDEIEDVSKPANDKVKAVIRERLKKLKSKLRVCKNKRTKPLTPRRLQDIDNSIQLIEKQIEDEGAVLLQASSYNRQRFQQRVKRLTKKLVGEKRTKHRKSGAGAKSKLDSEDEEFITKAIETMGSAHGRRHDSVLYLNNRLKCKDLLSVANHNLAKRGKRLIKSAQTVMSRSKPKKINTREGKKHKGKWLFCIRKPPKTEEHSTEMTHHQRAHVKLNRWDMFGSEGAVAKHSIELSFDDKAYVRPGTDVGFRDTKSRGIIQLTDVDAAKKLPQHDFGNPDVYVTPSAVRAMRWSTETIDGVKRLVKEDDQSFVTLRPKKYVGSSGSVWASNLVELHHKYPNYFQPDNGDSTSEFSIPLRSICARVRDVSFYFIDTSTDEDIISVSSTKQGSEFRKYEVDRLRWLSNKFKIETDADVNENETKLLEDICTLLQQAVASARDIETLLSKSDILSSEQLLHEYGNIYKHLESLVQLIDDKGLSNRFRYVAEYTDAGPGVGVSNIETKIRFVEMCRLHQSDRRIRLHRAPGDSAQNEAERTNACIGDAMVDGGTLHWEKYKPLEGMSEEEIKKMSIEDIEDNERQCNERNAWYVAEQLAMRIDDEPGPGGDFMIADVSESLDEQFYTNKDHLLKQWEYKDSLKDKGKSLPAHGYFTKLHAFYEKHCEVGDLYIEFRKCGKEGDKCDFCLKYPALEGLKPVPRPFPDYDAAPQFKYKSHSDTPILRDILRDDGMLREIDDFNPRVQIKNLFEKGEVSSADSEAVHTISKKYIVEEDLVYEKLRHLEYLKLKRTKRAEAKKKKQQQDMLKSYHDYDWIKLYRTDKLGKLTGQVLDKYINHHELRKCRLVAEKLTIVKEHIQDSLVNAQAPAVAHIAARMENASNHQSDSFSSDESSPEYAGDSTGEENLVLADYDSTEHTGSGSDTQEPAAGAFFALGEFQTRIGRSVRPPSHFNDCF